MICSSLNRLLCIFILSKAFVLSQESRTFPGDLSLGQANGGMELARLLRCAAITVGWLRHAEQSLSDRSPSETTHVTSKEECMDKDISKATSQGINDTVQKALKNVQFPASKQDVVRVAQQNNVPAPIMEKLRNIPGDQYNGPQDVMRAVQQLS